MLGGALCWPALVQGHHTHHTPPQHKPKHIIYCTHKEAGCLIPHTTQTHKHLLVAVQQLIHADAYKDQGYSFKFEMLECVVWMRRCERQAAESRTVIVCVCVCVCIYIYWRCAIVTAGSLILIQLIFKRPLSFPSGPGLVFEF